jgi:ChpA-C
MQFRKRAAVVLAASASAVALMGAPAFAATAHHNSGPSSTWITSGDGSILGGNQVFVPINIPVNVCGNAIAVLGIAGAGCQGGASVLNSY